MTESIRRADAPLNKNDLDVNYMLYGIKRPT